jgi:hypothetical protein
MQYESVGACHACQVKRGVRDTRDELLKWYLITYQSFSVDMINNALGKGTLILKTT